LSRRDFINWVAEHEDHIRHAYSEDERDADADMLTVWIDHAGQSPSTCGPIKRPPPATSEKLRTSADRAFGKWWQQLDPAGTLALTHLDRDEAKVVWREAFGRLWEDLELVHDSAKAYAEVVAETAWLELAYIIDRFHHGKLSLAINDVMKYWYEEYVLERHRCEEAIFLRVLRVNEECGG
jgi:hypothetical protein